MPKENLMVDDNSLLNQLECMVELPDYRIWRSEAPYRVFWIVPNDLDVLALPAKLTMSIERRKLTTADVLYPIRMEDQGRLHMIVTLQAGKPETYIKSKTLSYLIDRAPREGKYPGGKPGISGRKTIYEETMIDVTVALSAEQIATFKMIGNGNIAAGVRKMHDTYQ